MTRKQVKKLYRELAKAQKVLNRANGDFAVGLASYQDVKDAEWIVDDIDRMIDKAQEELGEWFCTECEEFHPLDYWC